MAEEESSRAAYPMAGGYAKNSSYQKAVVDVAKELIREGIMEKLDFKNPNFHVSNRFLIADYGCSIGPNTFYAVQNLIQAINQKYQDQLSNHSPLEFLVYFSDHTENDFNTLFQSIPPDKDYFAVGLPGSFHEQLLPKSSLHLVHSSCSLHWLSMVPKEILDNTSASWNKDSIICGGLNKEVKKAYLSQFESDLNKFLNARAKEIVCEGIMMIQIPTLPEGVAFSETGTGAVFDCLGSALMDLATTGIITKEEAYSFNISIYYPTAKELEDIINKNGYFKIEKIEILDNPLLHIKFNPQMALLGFRAVFDGSLRKHFGDDSIVENIFTHFAKKLVDSFSIMEGLTKRSTEHFIILKRKFDR